MTSRLTSVFALLLAALLVWQASRMIAQPAAPVRRPVPLPVVAVTPVAEAGPGLPAAEARLAAPPNPEAAAARLRREIELLEGALTAIREGRLSLIIQINREIEARAGRPFRLYGQPTTEQMEKMAVRLASETTAEGKRAADEAAALAAAKQALVNVADQYGSFLAARGYGENADAILLKLSGLQLIRDEILTRGGGGLSPERAKEVYRQKTSGVWAGIRALVGEAGAAALKEYIPGVPARQEFAGALRSISSLGDPPPPGAIERLRSLWVEAGVVSARDDGRQVFGEAEIRVMDDRAKESLLKTAQELLQPPQYLAFAKYLAELR